MLNPFIIAGLVLSAIGLLQEAAEDENPKLKMIPGKPGKPGEPGKDGKAGAQGKPGSDGKDGKIVKPSDG